MIIPISEIENNNRGLMYLITTITVVCTTVMVFFGPYSSSGFGYNHYDFQWWQLLTAHFMHYDWQHLVSNMLALGLLLYLFPASIGLILKGFIVAIVLIDTYMLLSGVTFYVGFSGILYVIPGVALAKYLLTQQYTAVILIIVVLIVYTLNSQGAINLCKDVFWSPLLEAHYFGVLSGFLVRIRAFKGKNKNEWYTLNN